MFSLCPINDVEYMFDCPQKLREEEMIEIPDWAKNKVIYQILPSRFATDKKVEEKEWYKSPIDATDNIHGNLRGIINRLDYIKELGIDVIYLTPIFKSGSSHKYNIDDYYQIDPGFGTIDDFRELVNKAHEKGLYVIMDVANYFIDVSIYWKVMKLAWREDKTLTADVEWCGILRVRIKQSLSFIKK